MNKHLTRLICMAMCSAVLPLEMPCVAAESVQTPTTPSTPDSGGCPVWVPVRKRKTGNDKYAPSKSIDILMTVSSGLLEFQLPFEDYPICVEIEGEGTTFGYWTATFTDAASCEMPFDGTVGDYRLTLTTAGNSTYTGYFTLE